MTEAPGYDEERIAELLARLRPAPAALTEEAQELPATRRELDDIVARAEADAAFRAALVADLERALAQEGYEPEPRVLEALRRRLTE